MKQTITMEEAERFERIIWALVEKYFGVTVTPLDLPDDLGYGRLSSPVRARTGRGCFVLKRAAEREIALAMRGRKIYN